MKIQNKFFRYFFSFCFCIFSALALTAQISEEEVENVYVDENGVLRWGETGEEIHGFGVNYTAPFAHAFRTAEKLDVDLKEAIKNDVYHLERLGFDLYRVHVWDTEISDEEGNLLENEHLKMFDFLVKELKDRGFNFVITPIAFWRNGWPEPDEDTPGFSDIYGKDESLVNPEAIEAQQNYLAQFLDHVNPYTGIAYKNDPDVIAFEVSNEPHHRGDPKDVKEFIQKMITAMRSTGTKKPIFYNISHSVHLVDTYFDSGIQGGTFQWYPTGLGYGKPLEHNVLPNVDDYEIPFDSVVKQKSGAKLVYEFDAADVMGNYAYPAMARSFREAGIQLVTHFAYDPTYMAAGNTEYNTHYMNLAYTPQKALALMIASEVFHRIPMYKDFGTYPENTTFEDFRVSYKENLTELNLPKKFIYTNNTETVPKDVSELEQIAGCGDSEVVEYEGKGAYFLDKLKNGIWRLEVMPDAVLVGNPFGKNSLEKKVAVITWQENEMKIDLPQLGENFSVTAINEGNTFQTEVRGNSFNIWPGTYFIVKNGVTNTFSRKDEWKDITLNEFFAPEENVQKIHVVHKGFLEISGGDPVKITAQIVAPEQIQKVSVLAHNSNVYENLEMKKTGAYSYEAVLPENLFVPGFLKYNIVVETVEDTITFPGRNEGHLWDWDFVSEEYYDASVVNTKNPIELFNAKNDARWVIGEWMESIQLVPTSDLGEAEYQVNVSELFEEDPENLNAEPVYDHSFKFNFGEKIKGRRADLLKKEKIVIKGRSLNEKPVKLQIALVMKNGKAFGKIIELNPETAEKEILLSELEPVKTVLLPRPYPTFLPYYFDHDIKEPFDIENIESVQFSIGPGIKKEDLDKKHGVGIVSVRLE